MTTAAPLIRVELKFVDCQLRIASVAVLLSLPHVVSRHLSAAESDIMFHWARPEVVSKWAKRRTGSPYSRIAEQKMWSRPTHLSDHINRATIIDVVVSLDKPRQKIAPVSLDSPYPKISYIKFKFLPSPASRTTHIYHRNICYD